MASLFSTLHYYVKDIPQFRLEDPEFDIKKIYEYYRLRHQQHPIQAFINIQLGEKLQDLSTSKEQYDRLYLKSKRVTELSQRLFEQEENNRNSK